MIRSRSRIITLVAIVSTLAVVAAIGPGASAQQRRRPDPGFQGETGVPGNFDQREGRKAPTGRQEAVAAALKVTVRWNDFGTPQSLIRYGGFLAEGLPSDPATAARQWIADNRTLFRLSEEGVEALELVNAAPIGAGSVVLFQQRFGDLPSRPDGLVTVGVVDGKVAYLSSSITGDETASGVPTLSAEEAFRIAARNVGVTVEATDISDVREEDGWMVMTVAGFDQPQRVRLVALPTPRDGVRPAYETLLADPEASFAFTHFVDARTGEALIRESLIDYAVDNPMWDVFPAYPPLDYSSTDTRELWCWEDTPGCDRAVMNPASPVAWDVDAVTETPTFQTRGNNARATEKWESPTPGGPDQGVNFSASATRDYTYPWTNQWLEEACDPAVFTSPEQNDIDAARANLFAMHNRMHDWSYNLGFTEVTFNAQVHNFGRGGAENDPEHGNAQAGGISGGFPTFSGRDNANQFTPPDGMSPTTNMFLWQPIPGAFYAPCVDGDYDMSVIAHEYTHMISNRMVAGPDERLQGLQANAMGESWSDLVAVEIMNEYGVVPPDQENRFAVGAYVTTDDVAGIRNYDMTNSPLNYSDVGYDLVGPQVHADGEIWSATNFDIRSAMNARYGAGNAALQEACAEGEVPVDECPGNRRWIQIVFDAWLLMPSRTTMLNARDAMLASDMMRFGGANQDLLWNVFASRGMGTGASSPDSDDSDPVPDFTSPFANEATVSFEAVGEGGDDGIVATLYVGHYEARVTPIADTDPATPLGATFQIVPGTYDLLVRADGYGHTRTTATFKAGQVRDFPVLVQRNLASSFNGAAAVGDGTGQENLIDDTEASNWAFIGTDPAAQEEAVGKQVTVRLDPSRPSHVIRRVQVSAMLRPQFPNPFPPPTPNPDPPQNRFSALRQFQIWTCLSRGGVDCTEAGDFSLALTSPADAFPSIVPRPRAPELIVRSFAIPQSRATHVRLVVLTNQCIGFPGYRGEQDNDPRFTTDCVDGSAQDDNVRAAELQVFSR
jgi:extracellular elastinolytic metalloproteinase